jgi:hypothetical protein
MFLRAKELPKRVLSKTDMEEPHREKLRIETVLER